MFKIKNKEEVDLNKENDEFKDKAKDFKIDGEKMNEPK